MKPTTTLYIILGALASGCTILPPKKATDPTTNLTNQSVAASSVFEQESIAPKTAPLFPASLRSEAQQLPSSATYQTQQPAALTDKQFYLSYLSRKGISLLDLNTDQLARAQEMFSLEQLLAGLYDEHGEFFSTKKDKIKSNYARLGIYDSHHQFFQFCGSLVISNMGHFITATHCMDQENTFIEHQKKRYPVKKLAISPSEDIALGMIDPPLAPTLSEVYFGMHRNPKPGSDIFIYSYQQRDPSGQFLSGLIHKAHKDVKVTDPDDPSPEVYNTVRTSVPIAPGDSGSPCFDVAGIIGVTILKETPLANLPTLFQRSGRAICANIDGLPGLIGAGINYQKGFLK